VQRAAWLRRGRGAGTHLSESWVARMGPFGAWKDQPRQRKGSLADADVCCGVWPAFRSAGCIVAGIPGAPGAPCAHGAVVPVKRIGGRARSTGHAVHGGATERDRESSVTARRRCTAAGSACAMGWVRAGDAVVPRITASRCTLQRAATSKDGIIKMLLDVLRRRRSTHKVRGRLRGGGRRGRRRAQTQTATATRGARGPHTRLITSWMVYRGGTPPSASLLTLGTAHAVCVLLPLFSSLSLSPAPATAFTLQLHTPAAQLARQAPTCARREGCSRGGAFMLPLRRPTRAAPGSVRQVGLLRVAPLACLKRATTPLRGIRWPHAAMATVPWRAEPAGF
jgi:hypothetical protein